METAFLIPYMAIRLNDADPDDKPSKRSQLGEAMTKGASVVGLTGATVCLISTLWSLYGRADGGFGGIMERWQCLIGYLGSERLAYAFIWDICLYTVFQPWLIGENLQNVKKSKVELVRYLRFVPVLGLLAYLLSLNLDDWGFLLISLIIVTKYTTHVHMYVRIFILATYFIKFIIPQVGKGCHLIILKTS